MATVQSNSPSDFFFGFFFCVIDTVSASGDTLRPTPFTGLTLHHWAYMAAADALKHSSRERLEQECQPQSRVTCSKGMMRWPADRQLWLWGQPDWGTHRHAISHTHRRTLNMETIARTEWMLDNITHLENQRHWRCKAWIELKSAKPR